MGGRVPLGTGQLPGAEGPVGLDAEEQDVVLATSLGDERGPC